MIQIQNLKVTHPRRRYSTGYGGVWSNLFPNRSTQNPSMSKVAAAALHGLRRGPKTFQNIVAKARHVHTKPSAQSSNPHRPNTMARCT